MWTVDERRLSRVRALMAERELDALVVRAPDNIVYLANYWTMKGFDALVFPREGEPVLAVVEPQLEEASGTAWTSDVRPFAGYDPGDPRPPHVRSVDVVRAALAERGLERVGLDIGCDTGNCGACTVIHNGKTIKSCMMLAVQADGAEIETVEGLAQDGELAPLQRAFNEHHGLQCGYCTPGMLMSATYLLRNDPNPDEDEIRRGIRGNLCRCTGYVHIVEAIKATAEARGAAAQGEVR